MLALAFLYPLALVVQQSVTPDDGSGVSLDPYADVFASEVFRDALTTTVWLAVGSTVGCLVLGFVLALVIAFVPFPGGKAVARFVDVFSPSRPSSSRSPCSSSTARSAWPTGSGPTSPGRPTGPSTS